MQTITRQNALPARVRRARAGAQNLVPTSTGAAKALKLKRSSLQYKMKKYELAKPEGE